MPENGQEKTPHSKMSQFRWQKWPFCKGYSAEPQNSKIIQELPFKIIRVVLCRNCSKTYLVLEKLLKSGKIGHFARAIVRQSGQKRFILSRNIKEPEIYKKCLRSQYIIFYTKIGLKTESIFKTDSVQSSSYT